MRMIMAQLGGLGRLDQVLFISRSYGIFYFTSKSFFCRREKMALITCILRVFFILTWLQGFSNSSLLHKIILILCNFAEIYLYG